MHIIETSITAKSVRVTLADITDMESATARVELMFSVEALKDPTERGDPLGQPEVRLLGEIQGAALLHARAAIDSEIRRLRDAGRQTL